MDDGIAGGSSGVACGEAVAGGERVRLLCGDRVLDLPDARVAGHSDVPEDATIASSLLAIARSIEQLSQGIETGDTVVQAEPGQTEAEKIRAYLDTRRRAKQIMGRALFYDPAWDILLTLYLNTADGRVTDVKTLALDTGAPQTTVIRWSIVLEKRRLLSRTVDIDDRRRVLIVLTPIAVAKIDEVWASSCHRRK